MTMKGRGHTQLSAGKPEIDNSVSCQRLLIIIPVHCSAHHLNGDDDDVDDHDVDGGVDALSAPHPIVPSSFPHDHNFHQSCLQGHCQHFHYCDTIVFLTTIVMIVIVIEIKTDSIDRGFNEV